MGCAQKKLDVKSAQSATDDVSKLQETAMKEKSCPSTREFEVVADCSSQRRVEPED